MLRKSFISWCNPGRLLTCVIVGGGPTSVEFAAEVYDFLTEDVSRWYPELLPDINVKLIEAGNHILGTFHSSLVEYTEKLFTSRSIEVISNVSVKEIKSNVAELSTGEVLPFGLMVWSTGIKPVSIINNIDEDGDGAVGTRVRVAKAPNGRLLVDDNLQLLAANHNNNVNSSNSSNSGSDTNTIPTPDLVPITSSTALNTIPNNSIVFALGDCATHQHKQLPPLAQVAQQQGAYLAKLLNGFDTHVDQSHIHNDIDTSGTGGTKYAHLGSMASVGDWKAVFDAGDAIGIKGASPKSKGFLAFILWREAYWTKAVSLSNKMLIPMYWFKSTVFGRDISRF